MASIAHAKAVQQAKRLVGFRLLKNADRLGGQGHRQRGSEPGLCLLEHGLRLAAARVGKPVAQRDVKAPALQHMRVAPAQQQILSQLVQRCAQAAGQFFIAGWRTIVIELARRSTDAKNSSRRAPAAKRIGAFSVA